MGNLTIGSVLAKDPTDVASVGAVYWQQVMLSERQIAYDEHAYPGYDLILTKKLGSRDTMINGSLVIHAQSEELTEAMFETMQAALVDSINDLETPRGTKFERVRCMRFQGSRMYKWGANILMFVEFSFKALQPET